MTRPFDPERYVRVLASDGRDRRGALVYAGASVVAHPDEPSVFAIDSPETRTEFAERGFAWTPERRARNYFPVPTRESLAPFELARVASANFFAALEINLRRAVGTEAPFATRRFLRKTKIAGVRRENDLSSELRELLWRAVGNPSDLEPSDEWRAPVEDASRAELFRLTGKSPALVLALFLAPVAVAPDEPPKLVPPSGGIVEAAKVVGLRVPVIARLDGTNVDAGRKILKEASVPGVYMAEKMEEGAKQAVELAKQHKAGAWKA